MAQTVSEVLTAATDSVTLINEIDADTWDVEDMDQADINETVQRNVDHIKIILAYEPFDEDDDTPDVAGDSSDKSSYTDAIATGEDYVSQNS